MAIDMTPQDGDYTIHLPITFDYRGGRSSHTKSKVAVSAVTLLIEILGVSYIVSRENFEIWQKVLFVLGLLYAGLFVIRFFVFSELRYSDIFETLKAKDFKLETVDLWQIFDIDTNYPYICYFKNGYKGIFVRMERGAITGKSDDAMFRHYDIIGDAYNLAHTLNLNITHLDYMDNIGNDQRMNQLYDDLVFVDNPDMQDMLVDIYSNLQEVMSRNYTSFDVYLFLTRDNIENFMYNVQLVAGTMLGGNFVTYKVLDHLEVSRLCVALFNLHDFSVVEANERVLQGMSSSGITPIKLVHADGTVEEFNKTVEEKRILTEEKMRKINEQKAEQQRKRQERRKAKSKSNANVTPETEDDEELDIL